MRILLSFVFASFFLTGPSFAQEIKPIEGIGPTGPLSVVAEGFKFAEGPAADANGRLYFSDVTGSKTHRLADDGSVETLLEDSGMANGLMFNRAGMLLACQFKHGRIVSIDVNTKEVTPLASEYNGKRFNTTNDLTIDSAGGLYFTDPSFGKGHQDSTAFYYVTAGGTVTRMADDLEYPNGISLSPDEKTLYVLPFRSSHVMAYEVKSPGVLGTGKVLCDLASKADHPGRGGDGMTVDAGGNLYVTVPILKSIQVIDPNGKTLGMIPLPNTPTNCTFAGADRKTLYVTTAKVVYALPMQVQGHNPGIRNE
jgi:gluconolactonase